MKFKIIGSVLMIVIILIAAVLSHSGSSNSTDGSGNSEPAESQ